MKIFKNLTSTSALVAVLLGGLFLSPLARADARTKLTTLPGRDFIRIDLKNQRFTLVEEERTINMQKGGNQVEFAWANTHIDRDSIQLRPIKTPGRTSVINVNYPPGQAALFWEVYSEKAGPAVFRISYLISNIHKIVSYEAIADRNEKFLRLKTYFTMGNFSGERFENAKLQVSIGKSFQKSFLIGESKKMMAATFDKVKIKKSYYFDQGAYGKQVRMYYDLKNTKAAGMGRFILPAGKVRIFQRDSRGSEAFIGEDWGAYTPPGRELKLFLGQAKEIKVKRFLYKNKKIPVKLPVVNYERVIKYQVENFKNKTVPLVLREHPGGEWVVQKVVLKKETGERNQKREVVLDAGKYIKYTKKDVSNLELKFNLPPTRKMKYNVYVHLLLKNRW